MTRFSDTSEARLAGVHPILAGLLRDVTEFFDCTILGGVRTPAQQSAVVAAGKSQTLASKHLIQPDGYGHAVDVAPTPTRWDDPTPSKTTTYDVEQIAFLFFTAGFAAARGINVRIGADWNGDRQWQYEGFRDLDHIELGEL